MITTVAVVPSTPLVLPDVPGRRHEQVRSVSTAAQRATWGLGEVDVVVVLAGGPVAAVHDAPPTSLAGYALDLGEVALAPAPADVVAGLLAVLPVGAEPGGDLRTLARWVPERTPTVGIVVPGAGDDGVSAGPPPEPVARHTAVEGDVAAAILAIADRHRVSLLVAGDLGAGHGPKPPRPDAAAASARLDELVVAALDGGRPSALTGLDPDLCRDSAARATGALRVLGAVLHGARLGTVVRIARAPLGVGYVVASGG